MSDHLKMINLLLSSFQKLNKTVKSGTAREAHNTLNLFNRRENPFLITIGFRKNKISCSYPYDIKLFR